LDLSRLAIRQAYLTDVDARETSVVDANLSESVLAEAFNFGGSVALSADGAVLAAGTFTGQVCMWRLADRTPLWASQGHIGGVWTVALSADGRLVADLSSPAGGSEPQPTLILRPCPPQFCALGAEGYIDPTKFQGVFAADLPRDKAATMAAAQRPASLSTLVEPTTAAAWKSLPSWAVVATRDHAIGTANVRAMAQHAGASITEVAASHVVMLSQPDVVVRVIRSAAASLKP
jgi:pimeloyl-ACP methyl ester carboxylesterase